MTATAARLLTHAAAAAALAIATSAGAAAPTACITPAQTAKVITFVLPSIVTALTTHCAPTLPAGAFLKARGAALAESYRPAAHQAWPEAKRAITSSQDFPAMLTNDEAGFSGIIGSIVAQMTTELKPAECAMANEIVETVAPLPAENIGRLIGIAAKYDKSGSFGPFKICPGTSPTR